MTDVEAIRRARERNAKAVTLRPSVGQATSVTRATMIDGYRCEVREGPWTLTADMPKSEAGSEQGPTPGVLGRGALASCLAMGIVSWSAELGVPLNRLAIEVHADWDLRGEMGLAEGAVPGYSQLRIKVDIDSPAPEEAIRDMLARAERQSPYIDVFRRANDVTVEASISRQAAE